MSGIGFMLKNIINKKPYSKDLRLELFNFPLRFIVACYKLNVMTVGELLSRKPIEFLRVKGLGRKSLDKASDFIEKEFGYKWRYVSKMESKIKRRKSALKWMIEKYPEMRAKYQNELYGSK